MSIRSLNKTAKAPPVVGLKSGDSNRAQMAPIIQKGLAPITPPQNEMYDCGYAKERDARCRAFGMLGFPDSPEAQWGATPIHKADPDGSQQDNS